MQGCRWPLMYSTPQRSSQGGYGAQCILGEACERERRPVFHTDASSPTAICIPLEVTHLSVEDESKTSRQITFTNIIVFVMAERLRHMLPRCKMGCLCFMQGTFDGVSNEKRHFCLRFRTWYIRYMYIQWPQKPTVH